MTIRRFLVLVRGLGPNSLTAISLAAARGYLGSPARRAAAADAVVETTSAQESENVLAAAFGFAPSRLPS